MKIIGKHKSEVSKLFLRSSMRPFIWATAIIISALFVGGIICYIFISNMFFPLCFFCFLLLFFGIIIVNSIKKQGVSRELNRDKSTYRFEEIEFGENAISLKSFSYFTSSDHNIPYDSVNKICFSNNSIYIYYLGFAWGVQPCRHERNRGNGTNHAFKKQTFHRKIQSR